MRITAIIKYPPIQGGVSGRGFWMARALAERGHQVDVITNAGEVESDYRIHLTDSDLTWLEADLPNGGAVRLVSSGHFESARNTIPATNPYVTKLASLATEHIRRHGSDLVFSNYFEPYGLSGHLAAAWTGLPHVVQHAGSDRIRLMDHPELGQAYREVLRGAALVIGDPDLTGLGVAPARVGGFPPVFLPTQFSPDGPVADLNSLIASLDSSPLVHNRAPLRPGVPTFAIYGKLGVSKGSFDLLNALALVRQQGLTANLLVMGGGRQRGEFLAAAAACGLADIVWTIPFIPHWRVPEVLRACTAVCLLERDFPIEIHRPVLPLEVLACGTCAVVSEDVARTQPHLRLQSVAHVVRDPRDVNELAAALSAVVRDPARAVAMGRRGSEILTDRDSDGLGAAYEALFDRVIHGVPHSAGDTSELLALLRRHMPATMVLLGAHGTALARSVLDGGKSTAQRAEAFAEEVSGWVELTKPEVPCAPDVLREVIQFERHRLWLATETGIARSPDFDNTPVLPNRHTSTSKIIPIRSNRLRFDEFSTDIQSTVNAVVNGLALPERRHQVALYAFHKRGSLQGRVFRTTYGTRELIDLCDGTRTLDDIMAEAAAEHGTTAETVREQLRQLAFQQVVSLH